MQHGSTNSRRSPWLLHNIELWEFTAPAGENEEGGQPVPHRVAAASLDQAIEFMRREHADFIIVKAEFLGMIALLSGSLLD